MILRSLRRLSLALASVADALEALHGWLRREEHRVNAPSCSECGDACEDCAACGGEWEHVGTSVPLVIAVRDHTSRLHGPGDHGWRCGRCDAPVAGRKAGCGECAS